MGNRLRTVCKLLGVLLAFICFLNVGHRNGITRLFHARNASLPGPYIGLDQVKREVKKERHTNNDLISVPHIHGTGGLCHALFLNSLQAQERARYHQITHRPVTVPDSFYIHAAESCDGFIASRHYITHHITDEERNFPIAFSILMYKDVAQVERLLRAIYRPQNHYCIHVDKKASRDTHEAITAISRCFENVIIAPRRLNIKWGHFSILEAEIICLKELEKRPGWRYFINLTGQEFPLKINAELVKILKVYDGAVDVRFVTGQNNVHQGRTQWIYRGLKRTSATHAPPPDGVTIAKGSTHVTLSREFVEYVLHNQTAKALLEWVKDTFIPDETYFNSLNASPKLHIPGTYTGDPAQYKRSFTRYKKWRKCEKNGLKVRGICIVSIYMLPKLYTSASMFVNKLHLNYHPLASSCLEQLHYNRTRDQIAGVHVFKTHIYKTASFIGQFQR